MAKIRLEDIQQELAQDNWKVVSEEYVNLDTEMTFECPEGHRVYSTWKKLRTKRECPVCATNQYKNQDIKVPRKKARQRRFLALDQATKITGWAIFDGTELIRYGKFSTSLDDEIARDIQIRNWLISMIQNWKPDFIGIEGIQLQEKSEQRTMGVTVFETLARLQGILMATIQDFNIEFCICPTNTWRAHCGVKGRTRSDKKKSMKLLAKQWYDVSLSDDEADAIGIGKYVSEKHSVSNKMENWE